MKAEAEQIGYFLAAKEGRNRFRPLAVISFLFPLVDGECPSGLKGGRKSRKVLRAVSSDNDGAAKKTSGKHQ
jgi:hypothetical protein